MYSKLLHTHDFLVFGPVRAGPSVLLVGVVGAIITLRVCAQTADECPLEMVALCVWWLRPAACGPNNCPAAGRR